MENKTPKLDGLTKTQSELAALASTILGQGSEITVRGLAERAIEVLGKKPSNRDALAAITYAKEKARAEALDLGILPDNVRAVCEEKLAAVMVEIWKAASVESAALLEVARAEANATVQKESDAATLLREKCKELEAELDARRKEVENLKAALLEKEKEISGINVRTIEQDKLIETLQASLTDSRNNNNTLQALITNLQEKQATPEKHTNSKTTKS